MALEVSDLVGDTITAVKAGYNSARGSLALSRLSRRPEVQLRREEIEKYQNNGGLKKHVDSQDFLDRLRKIATARTATNTTSTRST